MDPLYRLSLATHDDIPSWMDLVVLVGDNFPGLDLEEYRDQLEKNIQRRSAICVKKDERVVGALLFSVKAGTLSCMAVHPEHRRKGIATAMIARMLELFPAGQEIEVTTFREGDSKGNAPRALYKSFGFEEGELVMGLGYPVQRFVLRRKDDPDIGFRPMTTHDLTEVSALWASIPELGFSSHFDTPERLARFLKRNEGLSTVAASGGAIVGALLCGHDGRRGFFYHIGVRPDFRGHGIASRLVVSSFEKLREDGIDTCFLFTNEWNPGAQAFWKSMGFAYAPQVMYQSRSIEI